MSDYKLVPVEPTSDMLCSGIDAYGIEDCLDADVHAIYTSMIAAAPAVHGVPVGWQLDLPDGRVLLEKEYPAWAEGGDGYRIAPLYAYPQMPAAVQPGDECSRCKGKGRHATGPIDCPAMTICNLCSAPAVQGEPVGEAGALRGASGFTTAVFESSKVPEGTKLYASPRPDEQQPAPDVAELAHALRCAMAFIKSHVAYPDITPEMQAAYQELEAAKPDEILARYAESINSDRLRGVGASAALMVQALARVGEKLRKRGGDLT